MVSLGTGSRQSRAVVCLKVAIAGIRFVMPLVKRAIEPVFVSRAQLDQKVKNELEGVTVNSLAGLIKQLSSLSKHAENVFEELFNDANDVYQRTVGLNRRLETLRDTVGRLDPALQEQGRPTAKVCS